MDKKPIRIDPWSAARVAEAVNNYAGMYNLPRKVSPEMVLEMTPVQVIQENSDVKSLVYAFQNSFDIILVYLDPETGEAKVDSVNWFFTWHKIPTMLLEEIAGAMADSNIWEIWIYHDKMKTQCKSGEEKTTVYSHVNEKMIQHLQAILEKMYNDFNVKVTWCIEEGKKGIHIIKTYNKCLD